MIVCGVLLQGSEAILAVCEQVQGGDVKFKRQPYNKIELGDDQSSSSIRSFMETVEAFARENMIESFVIKTRAKKGRMAGGGISFKMEAIFQLINDCSCEFVSPQALSHFTKNTEIAEPESLLKYQRDAFYVAAHFLSRAI